MTTLRGAPAQAGDDHADRALDLIGVVVEAAPVIRSPFLFILHRVADALIERFTLMLKIAQVRGEVVESGAGCVARDGLAHQVGSDLVGLEQVGAGLRAQIVAKFIGRRRVKRLGNLPAGFKDSERRPQKPAIGQTAGHYSFPVPVTLECGQYCAAFHSGNFSDAAGGKGKIVLHDADVSSEDIRMIAAKSKWEKLGLSGKSREVGVSKLTSMLPNAPPFKHIIYRLDVCALCVSRL